MAKCEICNNRIDETFLNKLDGTAIKVKDTNNKNQFVYICSDCQKKYKNKVKEELTK